MKILLLRLKEVYDGINIYRMFYSTLEDPRVDRTKKHLLLDIIALALCGVISGSQTWGEIEDFGRLHKGWFKSFLMLPNGIPSHNTISRIFAALDSKAFSRAFIEVVKKNKESYS